MGKTKVSGKPKTKAKKGGVKADGKQNKHNVTAPTSKNKVQSNEKLEKKSPTSKKKLPEKESPIKKEPIKKSISSSIQKNQGKKSLTKKNPVKKGSHEKSPKKNSPTKESTTPILNKQETMTKKSPVKKIPSENNQKEPKKIVTKKIIKKTSKSMKTGEIKDETETNNADGKDSIKKENKKDAIKKLSNKSSENILKKTKSKTSLVKAKKKDTKSKSFGKKKALAYAAGGIVIGTVLGAAIAHHTDKNKNDQKANNEDEECDSEKIQNCKAENENRSDVSLNDQKEGNKSKSIMNDHVLDDKDMTGLEQPSGIQEKKEKEEVEGNEHQNDAVAAEDENVNAETEGQPTATTQGVPDKNNVPKGVNDQQIKEKEDEAEHEEAGVSSNQVLQNNGNNDEAAASAPQDNIENEASQIVKEKGNEASKMNQINENEDQK